MHVLLKSRFYCDWSIFQYFPFVTKAKSHTRDGHQGLSPEVGEENEKCTCACKSLCDCQHLCPRLSRESPHSSLNHSNEETNPKCNKEDEYL